MNIENQHPQFWMQMYAAAHASLAERARANARASAQQKKEEEQKEEEDKKEEQRSRGNITVKDWEKIKKS